MSSLSGVAGVGEPTYHQAAGGLLGLREAADVCPHLAGGLAEGAMQ